MNPLILAIKCKSFQCLRYLVEKFGLRPSIKMVDIIINSATGEYPFKQWLLPVILKVKDTDSLTFLMKQPGFFFTSQDMNSFIKYAFGDNWLAGLKAFLVSKSAKFFFLSA